MDNDVCEDDDANFSGNNDDVMLEMIMEMMIVRRRTKSPAFSQDDKNAFGDGNDEVDIMINDVRRLAPPPAVYSTPHSLCKLPSLCQRTCVTIITIWIIMLDTIMIGIIMIGIIMRSINTMPIYFIETQPIS